MGGGEEGLRKPLLLYKPKQLGPLEKLAKHFLRWSKPRPAYKVVTGKLVVEPKVYFANERTFLVWTSLCVQVGAISIGILSMSYNRPNIMHVGLILAGLTFIFFVYSFTLFHRRAHALRVRSTEAPYDDRLGPTMVVAVTLICLLSNTVICLNRSMAVAPVIPPMS